MMTNSSVFQLLQITHVLFFTLHNVVLIVTNSSNSQAEDHVDTKRWDLRVHDLLSYRPFFLCLDKIIYIYVCMCSLMYIYIHIYLYFYIYDIY